MTQSRALTGTLEILEDETDGARITVEDILRALNHRGFGTLLLAPALLTILPTGAIPGVPALSAVLIAAVAVQIIAGRRYPWLPGRIKKISVDRKKLISTVDKVKPVTKIIDRYICPRLEILSGKHIHALIAAICLLLSLGMLMVGFVPFLPALICLPILFFGVGMSAKDGVLILCGFGFTCAALALILWLAGFAGGEERIRIGKPVFIQQSYSIGSDQIY